MFIRNHNTPTVPFIPVATHREGVKEYAFFQNIQRVVAEDPTFSNPQKTLLSCIQLIQNFIANGGNPALPIPELRIGNAVISNISCLEFIYRLSKGDFEGLTWDNLGTLANVNFEEVLRLGLAKIDDLIQTPLSIDELVLLIQCLFASDPALSRREETGHRLLNAIEKFLDNRGNPLFQLKDVRLGSKVMASQTVFELLNLVWKPPCFDQIDVEGWDAESNDDIGQQSVSITNRFICVFERCKTIIKGMLQGNLLRNEDFPPLIRCIVEFTDDPFFGVPLSEQMGEQFLALMEYFVHYKIQPNQTFSRINIGDSTYTDITCFQVAYLVWKYPKIVWNDSLEQRFRGLFDAFMSDPRTDLLHRFSELNISDRHFVNPSNIAYYRQKYPNDRLPWFFQEGTGDCTIRSWLKEYEGHFLERITVAHYAAIVNDYMSLTAFLEKEPRLLKMTCCMSKGKSILATMEGEKYLLGLPSGETVPDTALETDDKLCGRFTIIKQSPKSEYDNELHWSLGIHRITNVSLLHLAARTGNQTIIASLAYLRPNPAAVDSENHIPQHYLQFSVMEGLVVNNRDTGMMFQALTTVTRINSYPVLPQVDWIDHREGYDLHYDTSRKVARFAYQRLTKDSFGSAKRTGHRWIDNLDIPELNRISDKDFEGVFRAFSFQRGHIVPAEDATHSEATMAATFFTDNTVPQNSNLNQGAWKCLESYVRDVLAPVNELVEVFTGTLFVPTEFPQGKFMINRLVGEGVHVPTHLFKVIFAHKGVRTTEEVYILPNEALPPKTKFTIFKCDPASQYINYIQKSRGILFNQWLQGRSRYPQALTRLALK